MRWPGSRPRCGAGSIHRRRTPGHRAPGVGASAGARNRAVFSRVHTHAVRHRAGRARDCPGRTLRRHNLRLGRDTPRVEWPALRRSRRTPAWSGRSLHGTGSNRPAAHLRRAPAERCGATRSCRHGCRRARARRRRGRQHHYYRRHHAAHQLRPGDAARLVRGRGRVPAALSLSRPRPGWPCPARRASRPGGACRAAGALPQHRRGARAGRARLRHARRRRTRRGMATRTRDVERAGECLLRAPRAPDHRPRTDRRGRARGLAMARCGPRPGHPPCALPLTGGRVRDRKPAAGDRGARGRSARAATSPRAAPARTACHRRLRARFRRHASGGWRCRRGHPDRALSVAGTLAGARDAQPSTVLAASIRAAAAGFRARRLRDPRRDAVGRDPDPALRGADVACVPPRAVPCASARPRCGCCP